MIRLESLPHVRLIATDGFYLNGLIILSSPEGVTVIPRWTRGKGCNNAPPASAKPIVRATPPSLWARFAAWWRR